MALKACVSMIPEQQQQPQLQTKAPSVSTSTEPAGHSKDGILCSTSLPTGKCMFLKLHRSKPDQRCTCEVFIKKPTAPGAYCNCGHQASYHSYPYSPKLSLGREETSLDSAEKTSQSVQAPQPLDLPSNISTQKSRTHICSHTICTEQTSTLLRRIQRLESDYVRESQKWQDRLLQERYARQEAMRTIHKVMYTFSKFIENDIPNRFSEFEDKMENLIDCQQRLHDKIIGVDDFSMMLEDRLIEVEDGNAVCCKQGEKDGNEAAPTNKGEDLAIDRHVLKREATGNEHEGEGVSHKVARIE